MRNSLGIRTMQGWGGGLVTALLMAAVATADSLSEIELDLLRKAEKDAWRDMLIWLRDETEDRPSQPAVIRAGRFLQQ